MSNDATGDSATPEPINNPSTNTAADHDDTPDTAAELQRWKQIARRHEDRAKANADAAKELEKLRAVNMTDLERAIAETKSATRSDVLREVGAARVADHVRIAAAGRPLDVDAVLDGMNLTRFMDDDGLPDTKAIQAWVDRIAPPAGDLEPYVPQVPTGVRGPDSQALNGDPLLNSLKSALNIR